MITILIFILIGIELNMMHGLYLALIIIEIVLLIIKLICQVVNLVLKIKEDI